MLGHPAGVADQVSVAWLATSIATLGGALGAALETSETVREAAYTYQLDTRALPVCADPGLLPSGVAAELAVRGVDARLAERGMRVESGSGNIAGVTPGNVVTGPAA